MKRIILIAMLFAVGCGGGVEPTSDINNDDTWTTDGGSLCYDYRGETCCQNPIPDEPCVVVKCKGPDEDDEVHGEVLCVDDN